MKTIKVLSLPSRHPYANKFNTDGIKFVNPNTDLFTSGSGQIEQAKDCGCHVVVSDVGFYKEQWKQVALYNINKEKPLETAKRYTDALIEVAKRPSLKPAGVQRLDELSVLIKQYKAVYISAIEKLQTR